MQEQNLEFLLQLISGGIADTHLRLLSNSSEVEEGTVSSNIDFGFT